MKTQRPSRSRSTAIPAATLLAALSLGAGSLFAQTSGTWIGGAADTNWSTSANWNGGTVATGGSTSANVTATFSAAGQTINLDANQTVQKLVFSATSGIYTISGSGVLTLAGTTTPSFDGHANISASIAGTQGFNYGPGGARNLTLTGNNTYSGLTALSSGGKIYAGSNNALGATGSGNGTTITHSNNAAVQLHLYNSMTTAEDLSMRMTSGNTTTLTAGATLIWTENGTASVKNNITLGGTITVDRGSSGSTYTDTAGISVGSDSNLIVNGNITGAATTQASNTLADATRLQISASNATTSTATINGVISDGTITASSGTVGAGANGGLSVYLTGAGKTTFTKANTYTGSTKVNAGTLLITNGAGSGTGFGSVSVASGATFGGSGIVAPTLANTVTFASGSTIAPGDGTAAGQKLTFDLSNTTGGVTFASGAAINLDLVAGTTPLVEGFNFLGTSSGGTDAVFNNNIVNFSITGGILADGLYTLAAFDSANAYSGQWTIGTGLDSYAIKSLVFNANSIQLQIGASSVPEPSTFAVLGGVAALGFAAVRRRRR